jgi:excisionase family DNA binding protein
MPKTEYVTPTEAARILGVSRPTLYRMMDDGTLPYVQIIGVNKRKILRQNVEQLLKPQPPTRRQKR